LTTSMCGDNLFAAQSVLRGDDCPLIESAANSGNRFRHLRRLGCHDSKFASRELIRAGRGSERNLKLVLSRDAQTIAVQNSRVIFTTNKGPHLRNPRQVRRVQAADGPTSDDANTLHFVAPAFAQLSRIRAPIGPPGRAALRSPFHFYQVLGLADFFRYHRSEQTVRIIE
jgi:hypothetical protein